MFRSIPIALATVILLATVRPGDAGVSQGNRVRITRLGGTRVVGYLESSDAARVTLKTKDEIDPIAIPMDEVKAAEVSLGTRGYAKRGAVIGGVTGFVLGLIAGAIVAADDIYSDDTDAYAVFAAVTMASIGAGALIGNAIHGDVWKPIGKSDLKEMSKSPAVSP